MAKLELRSEAKGADFNSVRYTSPIVHKQISRAAFRLPATVPEMNHKQ